MEPNASRNKAILAMKRAVVATFDSSKWLELGYLLDRPEVITGHGRLLRSMSFGDDDYEGNVLEILDTLVRHDDKAFADVEEYVKLEEWLLGNDPDLHDELYGPTYIALQQAPAATGEADPLPTAVTLDVEAVERFKIAIGHTSEIKKLIGTYWAKETSTDLEMGLLRTLLSEVDSIGDRLDAIINAGVVSGPAAVQRDPLLRDAIGFIKGFLQAATGIEALRDLVVSLTDFLGSLR